MDTEALKKLAISDWIYIGDTLTDAYEITNISFFNEINKPFYVMANLVHVWSRYSRPVGNVYKNENIDYIWNLCTPYAVIEIIESTSQPEFISAYNRLLELINNKSKYKNIVEYIEDPNEP